MIYRPGINCGYLRLPEVVTPRGRHDGRQREGDTYTHTHAHIYLYIIYVYIHGVAERANVDAKQRGGEEGLEKSGGIHSYDRRGRSVRGAMHTHTRRFINFWDSGWNSEALKHGADLSPYPSRTAVFAECPFFTFSSLSFFFFSTLVLFLFFSPFPFVRAYRRKLNKSRAFCYSRRCRRRFSSFIRALRR